MADTAGIRLGGGAHLTARQVQVLDLLAEGMPNRDIAVALGIGAGTVATYVQALRWALCVDSRRQVVVRAHELGLLPAERRVAS